MLPVDNGSKENRWKITMDNHRSWPCDDDERDWRDRLRRHHRHHCLHRHRSNEVKSQHWNDADDDDRRASMFHWNSDDGSHRREKKSCVNTSDSTTTKPTTMTSPTDCSP